MICNRVVSLIIRTLQTWFGSIAPTISKMISLWFEPVWLIVCLLSSRRIVLVSVPPVVHKPNGEAALFHPSRGFNSCHLKPEGPADWFPSDGSMASQTSSSGRRCRCFREPLTSRLKFCHYPLGLMSAESSLKFVRRLNKHSLPKMMRELKDARRIQGLEVNSKHISTFCGFTPDGSEKIKQSRFLVQVPVAVVNIKPWNSICQM